VCVCVCVCVCACALSSLNREAVLALVGLQRQNKSIYSHNTFLIFDGHHFKVHNKVLLIRCLFLVTFYLKTVNVFKAIKTIIEPKNDWCIFNSEPFGRKSYRHNLRH
jgi:hypothetical protein